MDITPHRRTYGSMYGPEVRDSFHRCGKSLEHLVCPRPILNLDFSFHLIFRTNPIDPTFFFFKLSLTFLLLVWSPALSAVSSEDNMAPAVSQGKQKKATRKVIGNPLPTSTPQPRLLTTNRRSGKNVTYNSPRPPRPPRPLSPGAIARKTITDHRRVAQFLHLSAGMCLFAFSFAWRRVADHSDQIVSLCRSLLRNLRLCHNR